MTGKIGRPTAVFGNMYVKSFYNIGNVNRRIELYTSSSSAEQLFFVVMCPTNNSSYYVGIFTKSTNVMYEKVIIGSSVGHGISGNTLYFNAPDWSHILIFSNQGFLASSVALT